MDDRSSLQEYYFYERDWESLDELRTAFEWNVPEKFNIAEYVCDRWADADGEQIALYVDDEDSDADVYTFADVRDGANRLANYLVDQGVTRGDRIGVYLPPKPETIITHLAAWKIGAVTVPLSPMFGSVAVEYRLSNCRVVGCVVDRSVLEEYRTAEADVESLRFTLTVGPGEEAETTTAGPQFSEAIGDFPAEFDDRNVRAEDDAVIIYTSGTTGHPKGVRHAHRVLLGHLPGLVLTLMDMDVTDSDVVYSVAEWSWMGGLFVSLLGPWFYGIPVVVDGGGRFDPKATLERIDRYDVTLFYALGRVFTMLKGVDGADEYDVDCVRSIFNGGGKIDEDTARWMDGAFGAPAYNAFGQTEANMLLSQSKLVPGDATDPGTDDQWNPVVGKPVPGHTVALLDVDTGEPTVETDEVGEIAVRYEGDPVCLKGYFDQPSKLATVLVDGWWRTGDVGRRDANGRFTFLGRKDNVINYSGYRIGPSEIESCLVTHEAVDEVAVVGVSHEDYGEIPKAFVKLRAGIEDRDRPLVEDLQQHVKENLAKYKYPKEIEFVEDVPKTTTGKIDRDALTDE